MTEETIKFLITMNRVFRNGNEELTKIRAKG